ncbi:hypothetical protein [Clostridioides sp. ZZV15-6383]
MLRPELEALFFSKCIHSTLQCACREGKVFNGFIGFDECTWLCLWTQEEISTLSLKYCLVKINNNLKTVDYKKLTVLRLFLSL